MKSELAALVGARLRRLRTEAGMTQAAVSAASGILRPIVSRLESGRHEPSVWSCYRYAKACGRSLGDVFRGTPFEDPGPVELEERLGGDLLHNWEPDPDDEPGTMGDKVGGAHFVERAEYIVRCRRCKSTFHAADFSCTTCHVCEAETTKAPRS